MTAETDWSDYWAKEGASGEVLVNAEGEKHPALTQHWRDVFAKLNTDLPLIDLAAGGGAVFANLSDSVANPLFAVDISANALRRLADRNISALRVVGNAAQLPFRDQQFGLVVSQFGVEYAGQGAVEDAARLVGPGGFLEFICHHRGGSIYQNIAPELESLTAIRQTNFLAHAKALVDAQLSGSRDKMVQASQAFAPAERALAAALKKRPGGVLLHVYGGFRKLAEQFQRYDPKDVQAWLVGIDKQVESAANRYDAMMGAMLDEQTIGEIIQSWSEQGLTSCRHEPMVLSEGAAPTAWRLCGQRL